MKMAPADVLATRSDGETAVVAPSFRYCLGLYLITQRGARRALRKAFPLSAQLDTPATGPLSSLDTATVIPPVAQCDERQATSGVQITTGAKPDDLSVHIFPLAATTPPSGSRTATPTAARARPPCCGWSSRCRRRRWTARRQARGLPTATRRERRCRRRRAWSL